LERTISKGFSKTKLGGISLYLHLPFCETLCTYCGCNKKITTNHSVEEEYIDVILKEWELYHDLMNEAPDIRELHLGGGTNFFFSKKIYEYYWKQFFGLQPFMLNMNLVLRAIQITKLFNILKRFTSLAFDE
jgi:coproporphyrinogen III oxidase-like Fe-S oxidoreductase